VLIESKSDVELQENFHSMEGELPLNAETLPCVSHLEETTVRLQLLSFTAAQLHFSKRKHSHLAGVGTYFPSLSSTMNAKRFWAKE